MKKWILILLPFLSIPASSFTEVFRIETGAAAVLGADPGFGFSPFLGAGFATRYFHIAVLPRAYIFNLGSEEGTDFGYGGMARVDARYPDKRWGGYWYGGLGMGYSVFEQKSNNRTYTGVPVELSVAYGFPLTQNTEIVGRLAYLIQDVSREVTVVPAVSETISLGGLGFEFGVRFALDSIKPLAY